jgi:hypothetical protein
MNRLLSGLLASALATSFAVASIAPVNAASIYVPQPQAATTANANAVNVAERRWIRRGHGNPHWRHGNWRGHGGRPYWNGHRGYRHWRHGYRRHGDFWFPLAAFATGAIISGAIANDRPPAYGSSHEARCYARYRSYRAYDNTYQPYHGPRRQCTL